VRRAGAAIALVGLALAVPTAAAERPAAPSGGEAATIELAAQTAVAEPAGTFVMRLRLDDVPSDGSVRVVVHQRVRSRSELALSMEGEELRTEALDTVAALSELPAQPDGTRRLSLSLDPADGGLALRAEGVYPVEVIAQDATLAPVDSFITHLVMGPDAEDDAPPLGVAVVAEVSAPPALRPDGRSVLSAGAVTDMAGVVTGLAAAPGVPASIAARPETIDALLASPRPTDPELVAALRTSAVDRAVLSLPYVEVSPDSLADATLLDVIGPQLERGRAVLSDELGVQPVNTVALSPPALGAAGLDALAFLGVQRVVVSSEQVPPLDPGVISYSLAQPFALSAPEDDDSDAGDAPTLEALATDAVVQERLATDGSPGLVTSRVLAELALLRLEQPSLARSVVVPLEPDTDTTVVQQLLEGLDSGRPFAPMALDEAFEHAEPLLDAGGNVVDRPLLPVTPETITAAQSRALRDARADLETFAGLVGQASLEIDPLERQLLVATAFAIPSARRDAHVAAVVSAIDTVADQVSTPATFTLTLAAREGTIPLTIRNDSGVPLRVSIRLRSQQLEFPEGDTISQLLTEASTRIDIPVRARTSGGFPLQIDVLTPDGERRLSMSRYTVRSTAVSGAGLVLSVGAGAFLVIWWARHWRRTRRSARLVATDSHPAAGAGN
jgi:hypothetical protein